ncbi:MAG: Ppx/GppA family phosphatase [Pseudidiomarina maritima]|nr:Ppx/GppA family phosphatase [Pseudidiomarina maritima]
MTQEARFAAIDLGSNSFHLIIAATKRAGGYRIISRYRHKVRLAAGLDQQLWVNDAAIGRGLQCLSMFRSMLADIPLGHIRCVATATLRKASNQQQMIAQFEEALGCPIEVISGHTEAKLIYQGATSAYAGSSKPLLVLDIGGASTEVIVGHGTEPLHLESFDLGCVVWQQRFFHNQTISATACNDAIASARALLADHVGRFKELGWEQVSGASGTFRALLDLRQSRQLTPVIDATWLQQVLAEVIAVGHVQRLHELPLRRDRTAVFVGGLCILIALLEELGIHQVHLAAGALREGLLLQQLAAVTALSNS